MPSWSSSDTPLISPMLLRRCSGLHAGSSSTYTEAGRRPSAAAWRPNSVCSGSHISVFDRVAIIDVVGMCR